MKVTEETKCRICRGELVTILDLGEIYPSSFLKPDEKVSEDMKAPLALAECEDCKLVQLKHTVDLDSMYRQYWYTSSLNKSMVSSLEDIVREIEQRVSLHENDTVLDIGCNDGTLLSLYKENVIKIGYDPSLNIKQNSDFLFINDYFNASSYVHDKAKVITAIAMFYDLPDPHQFVEDVTTLLDKEGIFVIQFTDLMSMYKACAFDNICHEHLEYYKLADVKFLLETHGLEVIDVSYNKVNGGSIRITAAHQGQYPVSESVERCYNFEKRYMSMFGFEPFKKCIEIAKTDINNFLMLAQNLRLKVYLLGASTKGNTLLQVCEITSDKVPYAAEVNAEKFELRTAGTNIQIIPEQLALEDKPNFFLVPIWHFKDNLLKNPKIRDYIKQGGRLVFPLPVFNIVEKEDLKDD